MADEIIDIFDENNNFTWKVEKKSIAHKVWLWHRAVHVWIYNSKKELLIQKRAENKSYFPSVWDLSVWWHVGTWEKPIKAVLREIKEEIWIDAKEDDLKFMFIKKEQNTNNGLINNEILYVYLMKYDWDISKLKFQKEEVQSIKFVNLDKFEKDLLENNTDYIPHQKYWFEMIDIIRSKF